MTVKLATPTSNHRAIRLLGRICQIAGASNIIDDARVGLARHGVIAAVQRYDTPAIFDWLIDALSYQGVSNSIAAAYKDGFLVVTLPKRKQASGGSRTIPIT